MTYAAQPGAEYSQVTKELKQGDFVRVTEGDGYAAGPVKEQIGRIGRVVATNHIRPGAFSVVQFGRAPEAYTQQVWHVYLEKVDVLAELAELNRSKEAATKMLNDAARAYDTMLNQVDGLQAANEGLRKTNAKRARKSQWLLSENVKLRDELARKQEQVPIERESVLLEGFAVGYRKGFADGSGTVGA
jgi:hypothetical protein